MAFGFLGAFRQTQWFNLRRWLLNERRAVDARIAVIDAELSRIGSVVVEYASTEQVVRNEQGTSVVTFAVTETRSALYVTEGSSIHKLFQAYIAMGGNPCEISLFLTPDEVAFTSEVDPVDDYGDNPGIEVNSKSVAGVENFQPGFGVVSEVAGSRGIGGQDRGGFLNWGRFAWSRIGQSIDVAEAGQTFSHNVDWSRRWANQAIQERFNNIEAKIIKLADLREQLLLERDQLLVQSVGGGVSSLAAPDPQRFHTGLSLTAIVTGIDQIFYGRNSAGELSFEITNTAKLAEFDTLWVDRPDDDTFTAL